MDRLRGLMSPASSAAVPEASPSSSNVATAASNATEITTASNSTEITTATASNSTEVTTATALKSTEITTAVASNSSEITTLSSQHTENLPETTVSQQEASCLSKDGEENSAAELPIESSPQLKPKESVAHNMDVIINLEEDNSHPNRSVLHESRKSTSSDSVIIDIFDSDNTIPITNPDKTHMNECNDPMFTQAFSMDTTVQKSCCSSLGNLSVTDDTEPLLGSNDKPSVKLWVLDKGESLIRSEGENKILSSNKDSNSSSSRQENFSSPRQEFNLKRGSENPVPEVDFINTNTSGTRKTSGDFPGPYSINITTNKVPYIVNICDGTVQLSNDNVKFSNAKSRTNQSVSEETLDNNNSESFSRSALERNRPIPNNDTSRINSDSIPSTSNLPTTEARNINSVEMNAAEMDDESIQTQESLRCVRDRLYLMFYTFFLVPFSIYFMYVVVWEKEEVYWR